MNSLYFDDVDFSSVRDNLAGVPNRKKLRLRWYGHDKNSTPFFEVKIKSGRLVRKYSYSLGSLQNSLLDLAIKDIESECKEELKKQQVIFDAPTYATLQVSYDRRYYEDLRGVRITVDENIKFYGSLPNQKLNETLSIPYHYKVMEIKFDPKLKTMINGLIKPNDHIIELKRNSPRLIRGLPPTFYHEYYISLR